MRAPGALRRVRSLVDRLDAIVWEAERRQGWLERYTIPPGRESWYARLERLREEQERGQRD